MQTHKLDVNICPPCHCTMGTRRKRSSDAPATKKKMEHQELFEATNICTYWPNNPAFDQKRVLLRRLFFINEDLTKYVSVGFYPARDYLQLVELGVV